MVSYISSAIQWETASRERWRNFHSVKGRPCSSICPRSVIGPDQHTRDASSLTQLDSDATAELQKWLKERADSESPEIKRLLEQLHEFGSQVHLEGFDSILRKKIKTAKETATVGLVESIANWICRETGANQRAVAMKSLQETLFLCINIDSDLPPSEVGRRLETYVELSGSKGLIRLFLSIHFSNLIFFDLHNSLQEPAVETFQKRVAAIEQLCQTAAGLAVRSWRKWPELTNTAVSSAIQITTDEIRKAVDPKAHKARQTLRSS